MILRETRKGHASAHADSVDDTADVEPHGPHSEPVGDTTEHNNEDLDEHDESSHDADSNRSSDDTSADNPEDELQSRVDYMTMAMQKNRRLAGSTGNDVVDLEAEPDFLGGRQG